MATVKESHSALRFTASFDILLFKEVIAQNPFICDDANEAWERVGDACTRAFNKRVSPRAAKDRCLRQLAFFVTEDNINFKRSGTDEEYGEKKELLQEIKSLKETGEEMNKDKMKKVEKRKLLTTPGGSDIRLAAMRGLNATGDQEGTTSEGVKKQRISSSHKQLAIIDILEKKQQAEERLKERQLQLEERKLALEERKVALEEQRMQLMSQGRIGNPEY